MVFLLFSFYGTDPTIAFANFQIIKITETNLSANQERAEMEKKRLKWKVQQGFSGAETVVRGGPVDPSKLVVELGPMEIRTFILNLDYLAFVSAAGP